MSELTKILLTSSLTALGAIVVFVASQLLGKLVIEPVQDLKKLLGEIRYALVFHAQAIFTPVGDTASEDEAAKVLRRLACDLRSKIGAVPYFDFWAARSRSFLPSRGNVFEASKLLMRLSNSVHQDDRYKNNHGCVERIEKLLGYEPFDE